MQSSLFNAVCRPLVCMVATLSGIAVHSATLVDDIKSTYAQHNELLQSLKLEYDESTVAVGPADILYGYWKIIDLGQKQITLVTSKDKVHYGVVEQVKAMDQIITAIQKENPARFKDIQGDIGAAVSFEEAAAVLPNVPPKRIERTLVYDGALLRERSPFSVISHGKALKTFFISDPRTHTGGSIFPSNALDAILYGFEIEGLPQDSQQRAMYRMPDLLSVKGSTVPVATERLDGRDCAIIELPNRTKVWLDVEFNYAVRRREWFQDGNLTSRHDCSNFENTTGDIWIPRRITSTKFGDDRVPDKWRGQPLIKTTWTINKIEANDPAHDRYFTLEPDAGSEVVDRTLKPLDSAGNVVDVSPRQEKIIPSIAYVQPANEADVARAAKEAQVAFAADSDIGVFEKSRGRNFLIAANIAVVVAILMLLLVRRAKAH